MIRPLDLRLLPGMVGSWSMCVIVLRTAWGSVALVVIAAVACVCLAWPRRHARHRPEWRGWLSLTVAVGCLISLTVGGLAAVHVADRTDRVQQLVEKATAETTYTVTLTSEVRTDATGHGAHGRLIETGVSGKRSPERLPVYLLNASPKWQVGMRVMLRGAVSSGRDQMVFLRIRSVVGEFAPEGMAGLVGTVRDGVRQATTSLSPYPRGLIPGVAIGDTRQIPGLLDEALKVTSLAHITAVSGAHVAIVLATVMMALARTPPVIKAVIALGVLIIMVLVVLPTPSVLRASAMGGVTLVGLMTKRPRLPLPCLLAVVIALLLLDPWLATSIGFALSVAATAGIFTLTEPIATRLGGGVLARLVSVPLAAQISCAPLLLTFDASLATYSVPANILAMPALAPATILGLLSGAISLISMPTAAFLGALGQYFASWIASVAIFFANLPGARLPWIEGGFGIVSLVLVTLGAYVVLVHGILRRT